MSLRLQYPATGGPPGGGPGDSHPRDHRAPRPRSAYGEGMTRPDEDRVPESHLAPEERDPEASPEDAAEQSRLLEPGLEESEPVTDEERLVADEADEYR
jgi:hypothetical protein